MATSATEATSLIAITLPNSQYSAWMNWLACTPRQRSPSSSPTQGLKGAVRSPCCRLARVDVILVPL